ncbi:gpi-anchored wall transfer protein 1 [Moniliophthora roreri MCA 2997]|uniref:GPI-anchored wall transfer protein n=1 Tax=Moniliophthora roreri (strain MCA 2997) TaxID=1381753 RepID=V2XDB8_MONRO|nr:gpi-anchored wall transfer protein 1 [Moniliophthora roreri MCA 2997]
MDTENDYRHRKIDSVSGLKGSTITHINIISSAALASIALYYALRTRLPTISVVKLPASWAILILPLLLSMTIFADNGGILFCIFALPAAALALIPRNESGSTLPSAIKSRTSLKSAQAWPLATDTPKLTPLPCVTTYRAHMLLMSTLAILAVDFPVFPRSLAKCETFGVSLMDLGVGSFVFTQGLVSAIPLIKSPGHLKSPILPKILTITRKSFPIILIGLVRVILVKGTEYPEHETEYGTHWNFFITLAMLPLMQTMLHPLMVHFSVTFIGVVIAILHQLALSKFGLQEYVLNASRVNVLSANKEGVVSLTGYLAIHLLGLTTGTLILPPSPSYFRRIQKQLKTGIRKDTDSSDKKLDAPRRTGKAATELCAYAAMWWILMGITRYFHLDGGDGSSRRLINMSHIFWVSAYNTSFILGYMVLDMLFFPTRPPSKSSKSTDDGPIHHPEIPLPLLSAINKNGLPIFLLANVATGVINLTIPTLDTSNFWAMVILCSYSYALCAIAWMYRNKRLLQL